MGSKKGPFDWALEVGLVGWVLKKGPLEWAPEIGPIVWVLVNRIS